MSLPFVALLVIAAVVVITIIANVRIVQQSESYVIERLGAYKETWETGLHFKIPIIDRVAKRISLKERVLDFVPQSVITKDNVSIEIDTLVFIQVLDSKLYTYGVENPLKAIGSLTATTLRNIIGSLSLDETLTSREKINSELRTVLDEATDNWGVKVNRVELKDIQPPEEISQAMAKQMKAERDKRAFILVAEGKKESSILEAQGELEATKLRAEASKQLLIKEAEGKAEQIVKLNTANATAIKMISDADPSPAYLQLQAFEALAKVADGHATKLIVPSNLQDLTSLVAAAKDSAALKA